MPRVTKILDLDITPQQFVDACDRDELQELILLSDSKLRAMDQEDEDTKKLEFNEKF